MLAAILFFSAVAAADIENPDCQNHCTVDQRCLNNFTNFGQLGPATCEAIPAEAHQELDLPFDRDTEAVCTHSSGMGSHSSLNGYYALDLATEYQLPAATIYASSAGQAFVFGGPDGSLCPEPEGTAAGAEGSDCGSGWGNNIVVLHLDGTAAFYVHLDHPLIQNGVTVQKGDPIGVMGWTGQAGHRHLHWSVHRVPGSSYLEWVQNISQRWIGDSIPFRFGSLDNGRRRTTAVKDLVCPHAAVGGIPRDQQPRFRGIR